MKKLIIVFMILVSLLLSAENDTKLNNESMIYSTLWIKNSAEYRACAYQAYNLATMKLKEKIAMDTLKNKAIIVDVDETIINNSRFESKNILSNSHYPKGWIEWCKSQKTTAVPGAIEFLNLSDRMGVHIFYISNRKQNVLEYTMADLKRLGFPQINKENFLFKAKVSSKNPRREMVHRKYDVILLIGDDLNDFDPVYEKVSNQNRKLLVDQNREQFGDKFIILPNPSHGSWLKSIFDFEHHLSQEQRMDKMLQKLKTK